MARVDIAIATFRRPDGLRRLLRSLEALEADDHIAVMVADNDADGCAGLSVVDSVRAEGFRFPITAITVRERGVAEVRNALFGAILRDPEVDAIAMIDDDEWVSPHWLSELQRIRALHDADVVGGPVTPVFDGDPPAWAQDCRYFNSEAHPDGPVEIIWGACNALIARRALAAMGPTWFDREFGRSGGEDVEIFTRMKAAGRRFAWAAGAMVWEQVPARRMNRSWVLRRAYRIGNSDMFVQLRWHYPGRKRAVAALRTVAHAARSVAAVPLLLWTARARMEALCELSRVAGKIAALGGVRYHEYG